MTRSLEKVTVSPKPSIIRSNDVMSSFVSASFVFRAAQGRAGEASQTQLAITSNAVPDSKPVVLHKVTVELDGGVREVVLRHRPSDAA